MKSAFEPLLRANAKAFAIVAGAVFVVTLAWATHTEIAASRTASRPSDDSSRPAPPPSFPEHEPLGILAYVEGQLSPGADGSHLPVDPFCPPVDANGNPVREGTTLVIPRPKPTTENDGDVEDEIATLMAQAQRGGDYFGTGDNGGGSWGSRGHWNGGGNGRGNGLSRGPTPPRTIRYAGVFRRSDGTTAAWVSLSGGSGGAAGSFGSLGDVVEGAPILGGDTDSLRVRLPNGTEQTLTRGGDAVEVRPGTGTGGGAEDRQTSGSGRRMPTEEEIREIEARDPELGRRIREAMERHRRRQGGDD